MSNTSLCSGHLLLHPRHKSWVALTYFSKVIDVQLYFSFLLTIRAVICEEMGDLQLLFKVKKYLPQNYVLVNSCFHMFRFNGKIVGTYTIVINHT